MATTIDTTALFFGTPASLTVDGTEVGATLTPPKVMVQATQYAPEFQGAGGPVAGAVFNTKIKATVEFDVDEITAEKLGWSMPGSVTSGDTTTWRIGRVPSDAFKDVVLTGNGVDGATLVVTVRSALGDGQLSLEFSDSSVAGSHVVMTGYYDGSDPTLCPVSITLS